MIDATSPAIAKLLLRFDIAALDVAAAIDAYETARARFETFAAMDAPCLPDDSLDRLQVRLVRWQVANFGTVTAAEMALGVIEELGELDAARETSNEPEIDDAAGDAMIFACQYATLHRLGFGALASFDTLIGNGSESQAAGHIAHVTLKASQRVRGMDDPEVARFGAFLALSAVVDALGVCSPWRQLARTAETVMRRDWKRDAVAGGES